MSKFIELTYMDNDRFLLNLDSLVFVDENKVNGGPTLIGTCNAKNGKINVYSVKESFDKIKELIREL